MQKLAKILLIPMLTSVTAVAAAAPVGYSINSDSPGAHADSLYRIDLSDGSETWIAPVYSLGEARIDVEGLSFANDGILWGIDEGVMTLFPLNPDTGLVQSENEAPLRNDPGHPDEALPNQGNDFGMTFTCDGSLYFTSVAKQALYSLDLDGTYRRIGNDFDLGVNIGALAAWGDRLYGLGNGLLENGNTDSPAIYEIDVTTGTATWLFDLGAQVHPYAEGGLSFDDEGNLWAITDRRDSLGFALPSQILKIDIAGGAVTESGNSTSESGFESLAVTVPRGCGTSGGQNAQFKVEKHFLDGNEDLPTTLNIRCNTGLPLEQTFTTEPGAGVEVTFTVTDFDEGTLDCDIWESTLGDYRATYDCFSTGECMASGSKCTFNDTTFGQDNLCVIRNYPESVEVTVASEWVNDFEDITPIVDPVTITLYCRNIRGGDGDWHQGQMRWSWEFFPGDPAQVATVEPRIDGSSECRTEAMPAISAIESTSTCDDWTNLFQGEAPLTCTVTNTVFFEGIPTLSRGGLLLAVLLVMFTGLVFVRRF